MSDINTQNTFNTEVDQSLAIAKSGLETPQAQDAQILQFPELPVAERAIPTTSDAEQAIPKTEAMPASHKRAIKLGVGVIAASALLAGSIANAFSGDKDPADPINPSGVSEVSQPYELGSESVNGNTVDTTSEVALLVTKNIPGEQGGIDVVAQDIETRTEQNQQDSLSNTVWVPENADINPTEPGVQLVAPTDNKQ